MKRDKRRMVDEDRALRATTVCSTVSFSRSTLWRKVKAGEFPPPIKLGKNCVAWLESDVQEWLRARPRATGASEEA